MKKRMDEGSSAVRRPIPDSVHLVITTACSRRCLNCAFKYPDVWSADVEYVRDVMKTLGHVQKVRVTGGEPLEHPDISAIVDVLVAAKADGKCDLLTLETGIFHASAVHFDRIYFSDYGVNAEAARQLKRLTGPEVIIDKPVHVLDQYGPGKICHRGLTGDVTVYMGRVYPCCACVCVPGVQYVPLDVDWRTKILEVPPPCAQCRFSMKRASVR